VSKDNGDVNKKFLKLSRRFLQNELWNEHRVFSKAEAWIDILFAVQYGEDPFPIPFGYKTLICYRGQSLKSIETWAKRWNWSKSKVMRFFGMLKKRNMIRTETETVTTRLIVCNYEVYNKSRNANEAQVERKPERKRYASETQAMTVEEGKKAIRARKETPAGKKPAAKGESTWMTHFGEIWNKHIGNFSYKKSARPLKKVMDDLGIEMALAAWELYVSSVLPKDFEYASAAKFSETINKWIPAPAITTATKWDDITFDCNIAQAKVLAALAAPPEPALAESQECPAKPFKLPPKPQYETVGGE